jgi:hypothetical protein
MITKKIKSGYVEQDEKGQETKQKPSQTVETKSDSTGSKSANDLSEIVDKSNIEEKELFWGDYFDEWKIFEKLKTDAEKRKYLIKTFGRKCGFSEEDFKFGNYIGFSQTRQRGLYVIGKNGNFVETGGDDGDELPFEGLAQYLNDATATFKSLEFNGFFLRKDDKFIKTNIKGTIPDNWTELYYCTFSQTISMKIDNKVHEVTICDESDS